MNQSNPFPRLIIIFAIFLLLFGILVVNLWNQQVRTGEKHMEKISRQSIRNIRHPAGRGRIFSSDGALIAGNRPCTSLVFHISEMRQPGPRKKTVAYVLESSERTAKRISRPPALTEDIITRHLNRKPAMPMVVFEDLDMREITALKEMLPRIDGSEIVTEPQRLYPYGKIFAHLAGYVGREDRAKAEDKDEYFYYNPDMEGKEGLEKRFDGAFDLDGATLGGLRGIPGKSMVLVDYMGYVFDVIEEPEKPRGGNDIAITVDSRAQTAAAEVMEGRRGAFVLLDARTGAVIAMYSSPSFDPADFIPSISPQHYAALHADKDRPLVNRAISETYIPGSIVKPLIGLAAIEGGISPDDEVDCEGGVRIGNASIKCWILKYGGSHGDQKLTEAIKNSCNSYFIIQGLRTGMERIRATFEAAGLGRRTGIPLPDKKGTLPSRELKRRIYKESWTEFDTALISIGQGMVDLTPLQAAVFASAIANGGDVLEPYLVKEVRAEDGGRLYRKGSPVVRGRLTSRPDLLLPVRKGMFLAVNDPKGTARKAKNPNINLFGKTGTAEFGKGEDKKNITWFVGFGQKEDSLYGFSILAEEGLSGGSTCAPIASQFFDRWLED